MPFNDNWAIKLTVVLALVFALQNIFPALTDIYVLEANEVLQRPWTLVTSIFLHADFSHLFFNGFALVIFGMVLENIIGSRKFLALYFASGVFASIVFILGIPIVQAAQGGTATAALGASGAIFGVLGALAVLRPNMVIWLGFFPTPMWLAAIIWAAQDFFGIFIPSNVANFAHLGGLFLGVAVGLTITKGRINIGGPAPPGKALSEGEISRWEKRWM